MQMLVIRHRDVAQVVERYFREVEAASSSLVIPIEENAGVIKILAFFIVGKRNLFSFSLDRLIKIGRSKRLDFKECIKMITN